MGYPASLSRSVIWRLLWKEYRLQRALFVAILFGAAVLMALWVSAVRLWPMEVSAEWLWLLALGFPALYAIGCGATSFAGEDDAGTFWFQRSLPVAAGGVLAGKAVFSLFSLALVFGLLVAFAAAARWMAGIVDWPEPSYVLLSVLAAVELMAWGMLFSMWTRRPLLSVVLAGLAAACVGLVPWMIVVDFGMAIDGYQAGLVVRSVALPIVLLLIYHASGRWFLERLPSLSRAAAWVPSLPSDWGRLIWLALRDNRALLLGSLGLAVLFAGALMVIRGRPPGNGLPVLLGVLLFGGIPITFLVPTVLGLLVFGSSSQMRQMRFLIDRGVSGRKIWTCRQAIYGSAAALYSAIFLTGWVIAAYAERRPVDWHELMPLLSAFALWFFLSFSVAQWTSFFVQRKLAAFFLAVVIGAGLAVWITLLIVLRVPALLGIVPLGLILLAHTWIRSPWWQVRRPTVASVLGSGAAITLCVAAVVSGVIAYRVLEIPATEMSPELLAAPPALPEAEIREAEELYNAVLAQLEPMEVTTRDADAVFTAYIRGVELASLANSLNDADPQAAADADAGPGIAVDEPPPMIIRSDWWWETGPQAMEPAALRNHVQAVAAWYEVNGAVASDILELAQQPLTIGRPPGGAHETLVLASAGALIAGDVDAAVTYQLAVLRLADQTRRGMFGIVADGLEGRTYGYLQQLAAGLEPTSPLREQMRDAIPPRHASLEDRLEELRLVYHENIDLLQRLPEEPVVSRGTFIMSYNPESRNLLQWFPWERIRTRRLVDYIAQGRFQVLSALRDDVTVPEEVMLYDKRLETWHEATIGFWPLHQDAAAFHEHQIGWRLGLLRDSVRRVLED